MQAIVRICCILEHFFCFAKGKVKKTMKRKGEVLMALKFESGLTPAPDYCAGRSGFFDSELFPSAAELDSSAWCELLEWLLEAPVEPGSPGKVGIIGQARTSRG